MLLLFFTESQANYRDIENDFVKNALFASFAVIFFNTFGLYAEHHFTFALYENYNEHIMYVELYKIEKIKLLDEKLEYFALN